MKREVIPVAVAMVLLAAAPPVGAVSTTHQQASGQSSAYAGTHVSFDAQSNAVTDYAVNGETVLQSLRVQSEQSARSQGHIGVDTALHAMTHIAGSSVSMRSQASLSASVGFASGAEMNASDTRQGTFVVHAGDQSQVVQANLSGSSSAQQADDSRVVVTDDSGTKGTFIVVGGGQVTVNDSNNVSAKLGKGATLVFRTYPDGRDEADKQQEKLIADGKAAGEVTVTKAEDGGQYAAQVTHYTKDTTIDVTQKSAGTVNMTASRSAQQGRVIITSVSKDVVDASQDVQVTVDGHAAAKASSYSDLRSAIGGDQSKYMVRQRSSAEANAQVLVAVNHFSDHQVSIQSSGSSQTNGSTSGNENNAGSEQGTTGGNGPGFTAGLSLVALVGAALLATRRR